MISIGVDPRIKLLIIFYLNFSIFTASNQFVYLYHSILVISLFFIFKKHYIGIKVSFIVFSFLLIQYLITLITNDYLSITMSLIIFFMSKILFISITSYWFFITTKVSDFISALQKAKVPNSIIITFSIIFRFSPTMKQELWYIKSTMKLRGVAFTLGNIIRHPIKQVEYLLIPLITRSITISNRLAISSITRGLDLDIKRSSFNDIRLSCSDYIFGVIIVIISILGIYIGAKI